MNNLQKYSRMDVISFLVTRGLAITMTSFSVILQIDEAGDFAEIKHKLWLLWLKCLPTDQSS